VNPHRRSVATRVRVYLCIFGAVALVGQLTAVSAARADDEVAHLEQNVTSTSPANGDAVALDSVALFDADGGQANFDPDNAFEESFAYTGIDIEENLLLGLERPDPRGHPAGSEVVPVDPATSPSPSPSTSPAPSPAPAPSPVESASGSDAPDGQDEVSPNDSSEVDTEETTEVDASSEETFDNGTSAEAASGPTAVEDCSPMCPQATTLTVLTPAVTAAPNTYVKVPVLVTDQFGRPMDNQPVTFCLRWVNPLDAGCHIWHLSTVSEGVATMTINEPFATVVTVEAYYGNSLTERPGLFGTSVVTFAFGAPCPNPGTPSSLLVLTPDQVATAGEEVAVRAVLLNSCGAVLQNQTVQFDVRSVGGTGRQVQTATGYGGVATYRYTQATTAQDHLLIFWTGVANQVSPGTMGNATVTFNDRPPSLDCGTPAVLTVLTPSGTTDIEAEAVIRAQVLDECGNPLGDYPVGFDVYPTNGQGHQFRVFTRSNGVATVRYTQTVATVDYILIFGGHTFSATNPALLGNALAVFLDAQDMPIVGGVLTRADQCDVWPVAVEGQVPCPLNDARFGSNVVGMVDTTLVTEMGARDDLVPTDDWVVSVGGVGVNDIAVDGMAVQSTQPVGGRVPNGSRRDGEDEADPYGDEWLDDVDCDNSREEGYKLGINAYYRPTNAPGGDYKYRLWTGYVAGTPRDGYELMQIVTVARYVGKSDVFGVYEAKPFEMRVIEDEGSQSSFSLSVGFGGFGATGTWVASGNKIVAGGYVNETRERAYGVWHRNDGTELTKRADATSLWRLNKGMKSPDWEVGCAAFFR
jgi:hypothetical protein